MRTLYLVGLSALTVAACHASSDPQAPTPPAATAEPPPLPQDDAAAETATPESTAPVAVSMPSAEDTKAALALQCTKRKEGSGCTAEAGKTVIPFEYDGEVAFKASGLALVLNASRGWAYINARNERVFEPVLFDNGPDPIAGGLTRVRVNGKIGFADAEWRLVIAPQFDAAFGFEGGSAKVCVGCDPRVWSKDASPEATEKRGREFRIDREGNEL